MRVVAAGVDQGVWHVMEGMPYRKVMHMGREAVTDDRHTMATL